MFVHAHFQERGAWEKTNVFENSSRFAAIVSYLQFETTTATYINELFLVDSESEYTPQNQQWNLKITPNSKGKSWTPNLP